MDNNTLGLTLEVGMLNSILKINQTAYAKANSIEREIFKSLRLNALE